ncbi:MAG: hypothetical protein EPN34_06465 [Burkholderiaceae bacterium]|nr:MAG: hypothetical protein EPN34_06465 [Burkholderiaceae bacterium]
MLLTAHTQSTRQKLGVDLNRLELIIGTVVLKNVTAWPLAKWLKVVEPEPDDVLILGSDDVARAVGKALADQKVRVVLADDDWEGVSEARMADLNTFYGNATSHFAELNLDLSGLGQLLAMSTEREFNPLACLHYRRKFGQDQVFHRHVLARAKATDQRKFVKSLRARALFGNDVSHARLQSRLQAGWSIKATELTKRFGWLQFLAQHGTASLLLFLIDLAGCLHVAGAQCKTEPHTGWAVMALVPPEGTADSHPDADQPATVCGTEPLSAI